MYILLIIVCEYGYVCIVEELMCVFLNVNLNGKFYMLLIVVCYNGYVYVV